MHSAFRILHYPVSGIRMYEEQNQRSWSTSIYIRNSLIPVCTTNDKSINQQNTVLSSLAIAKPNDNIFQREEKS